VSRLRRNWRTGLRSSVKITGITILISDKPGVDGGPGIDFTSLFLSLGLILIVLGGMEVVGIPIVHVTGGVRRELFQVSSPVIPHLIWITVIPLVLEKAGRRKYFFITIIICVMLLVDLTIGYAYSLLFSILLWVGIFLFERSVVRLNRILLYSTVLTAAYVCLVGLHVLISPIIPIEIPLLNKFVEVLWKLYSALRWPAIILYTFLPYTLLVPLFHSLMRSHKPAGSMVTGGFFRKEIFSRRSSLLILIASMGLAAYLEAYNYMPKINPNGFPIGVDTVYYYTPSLRSMLNSTDPIGFAFSEPFASTRPFYMIFLYSIHRLTGLDALQTVESSPILLLPLLVASYYLLASRLFNLKSMGALAAVLTLAGIQTSVGVFTSYQANLLGLIIANLLATLALTVNSRRAAYPLISLLSFCLMPVHSWTSLQYVTIISIALAYSTIKSRSVEGLFRTIIIIVFTFLSVPFVNTMQQSVEGTMDPLHAAQATLIPMLSFKNLQEYWPNTHSLFTEWFSGFMANASLYLLVIVGMMRVRSIPEPAKAFLAAFPPTLFPLPLVNYVLGSRLYFNVPLQLYASTAIYALLQDDNIKKRLVAVLMSCLAFTYSVLAVANTGFILVKT
jgi:hypothetical protein